MIPFVEEILGAFKVFFSYLQLGRTNKEKPTVINVQPPKVEVVPQIHIELPPSDYDVINRKRQKIDETEKGEESFQSLDDQFYEDFGFDAEINKKRNDVFTIKEK